MKRRKATLLVAVVASLCLAVAGCGSDDSSGSSNSGNGGGASNAEYAAMLEEAMQVQPAEYAGPTDPAKAEPGIKIAAVSCWQVLQGCVDIAAGVMEAAEAAGWEGRTFDGEGDPTKQNAQIMNAVTWGADVILLLAIDPKTVQISLEAAEAKDILLLSANNATNTPNPISEPPADYVWPVGDVTLDFTKIGQTQARWMIADSEGQAKVLALNDNGFISVKVELDAFEEELGKCDDCSVETVTFAGSQIGPELGAMVVNYLRTHPDVKYIFAPYDPSVAGIITALHGAGMQDKVKITSFLGNKQNLEFIKNGDIQVADVAQETTYTGWAMVDQSIRLLNGQEHFEPWDENTPQQLLTADNLPDDLSKSWVAPFDYKSKFTALWQ